MKRIIILLVVALVSIQIAAVYCRKHVSRKTKHPSLDSFDCCHSKDEEIIHHYHRTHESKHHHHRKHIKHVHKVKKIKKVIETKPKVTVPCKDETLPSHPSCFFISYQIKTKQEAILKQYFASNPSFH